MKRREKRLPGQLFRSALAVLLVLLMILPAVGCAAGKGEVKVPEKKEETDQLSLQENQVNAGKENEQAEPDNSTFPLENEVSNYADNRVLVVLTHEESIKFKTYTPDDFSEISCVKVQNINAGVAEMVKNGELPSEDFNVILCLELSEQNQEGVLAAIQLLKDREDILSAEVDNSFKLDIIEGYDAGDGVFVPSKIKVTNYPRIGDSIQGYDMGNGVFVSKKTKITNN